MPGLRWLRKVAFLVVLVVLSTTCLLFFFAWPAHDLLGGPNPLPQQRRIQEFPRHVKAGREAASAVRTPVVDVPPSGAGAGAGLGNYSLPFLRIPSLVLGRASNASSPRSPTASASSLQRDQMMVLSMSEQGVRLSPEQRVILEAIDDDIMTGMKRKLRDMRRQTDHLYFEQLRRKGKIEPLPSGGERIVASQSFPVRFPALLNKIRPEEWVGNYRVFLNITYFPWPKTPSCSQFSTSFAPPGSLSTSALASFPSSGNTWIRYLLESSCGIFTGSMYEDSSLTRKGMYGEGVVFDSGMTILQKTHGYTTGEHMALPRAERVKHNHMEELNNGGIVIVRNPFKALISHRHLDVGGHTGYAPKSHFQGEGWKNFVLLKARLWKEFYIDWLRDSRPQDLHVVFYEDLKADPGDVLRTILKFLHLPVDQRRLDCIAKHSDGSFKRKPPKTVPLDMDPFTKDLKDAIYGAIEDVNRVLVDKGKGELPTKRYQIYDEGEARSRKKTAGKGRMS